ncbi:MAG TPA: SDR family NAD(P)-dependent oxidoreductase [Terriglobales bacterium]|nr:SDR family NAD(P)-dependent oxidoreductase [Terriglobales bacterium]
MARRRSDVRYTALVTGANRGIGFEVCRRLGRRGLHVVLTGRDARGMDEAVARLRAEEIDIEGAVFDVAREGAAGALAARLRARDVRVDVLVNNAGIYPPGAVLDTDPGTFREVMETNFFGALWTCRAFVPAMLDAGYGRVVNVSSGSGSFGEGLDGPAAYCVSKAALDALTVKLASESRGDVKVNAVCPGWVRTRMGGPGARRSVEKGAETIVWLATLPADGPNGGFFRDRKRIPW